MHIGPLTELETTIFNIKPHLTRPYERLDDIHQIISFELDPDLHRIDRVVYNGLDLLGDLGGLYEALVVVFGALVTLLNYQQLENHLVKLLFSESDNPGAEVIKFTTNLEMDTL